MRILETKVYTFEELSEEAKERAIEKNRRINVDYWEWYDNVFDTFKEKYSDLFEITNMYFSGFYSQGDGAMFEYGGITDKLIDEFIGQLPITDHRKKTLKENIYFSGSGKQHRHYYHEKCCWHSINVDYKDVLYHGKYPNFNELGELQIDFEAFIEERYIDLAQELYQSLEGEYEWHTSDESIRERLIEFEYEFTENGEII